jgi:serine/threonine protein kinase
LVKKKLTAVVCNKPMNMSEENSLNTIFTKQGYQYIKKLGFGGFGEVYLVKEQTSGHCFAIKRLNDEDAESQENILREIQAIAPINHPNIINYKNSFIEDGRLYLVMEYCANGSLYDELFNNKKLSYDRLIKVFLTLTNAMGFLHLRKIIHHDIKPQNILINNENELKISDFGCVNTTIGTVIYKAPELHFDASYTRDPRIDIYALGMTLMECAIGKHPLRRKKIEEQIIVVKQGDFPIDALPVWLQEIILKACSFLPENRFQSMFEFNEALNNKDIPVFLSKSLIKGENLARKLETHNKFRIWKRAKRIIETHYQENSEILNLHIQAGKYFLNTHQLGKARKAFEQALKINRNAPIEKDIAEVYLQNKEPVKATALLNNYLNRNFFDLEAHNQLLHAYFLTERWEIGYEQSKLVQDIFPDEPIISNNRMIFDLLIHENPEPIEKTHLKYAFINYNFNNVFLRNNPITWHRDKKPHLKSKLLFQEYRFKNVDAAHNEIEIKINDQYYTTAEKVVTFGRQGYEFNAYSEFEGSNVSRRHFLIVNKKNTVWLYDLDSTGIRVDGERVNHKFFLNGLHEVGFGGHSILIKSDSSLLV